MRVMMMKLGVFAVMCFAVACGPMGPVNYGGGPSHDGSGNGTSAQFNPYSAVRPDPATVTAVRIYEGDKQTLRNAGATFVGDLDVDAQQKLDLPFDKKRPSYDGLAPRAAMEAAKVGATHFVLVDAGVDVTEYTVQHAQEHTESVQVYDEHGRKRTESVTTYRPEQKIKTSQQRGRFALFRVDPTRWSELPEQLRPIPLEGVSTTPAPKTEPQQMAIPVPTPESNSKAAKKKAGY